MDDPSDWLRLPLSEPFYSALLSRESTCLWRAEDVILLIAGECDLILMDKPNSYGYQGLTQIGSIGLWNLGWRESSDGQFCHAAPEVQVDYAGRYFDYWRHKYALRGWGSAGQLWACNLAPSHLINHDGIVFSELNEPAQYRANRWLDLSKDGLITQDELTKALLTLSVPRTEGRYQLALDALASVRAAEPRRVGPE